MAGLGNGVGLASCLHESRLLWLQETETEQVRKWLMPKADALLALGGLEVRGSGWEPGLALVQTPSFPLPRPRPPSLSLSLPFPSLLLRFLCSSRKPQVANSFLI